jgi:hypothetical protein
MTKRPGDITEHNVRIFDRNDPRISGLPYVDDDWFRFYLDKATDTTYYEVHELCKPGWCDFENRPCEWQHRAEMLFEKAFPGSTRMD